MKRDDWYMWVNMKKGSVTMPVFQSLDAFYPGLQVIWGDGLGVYGQSRGGNYEERQCNGRLWQGPDTQHLVFEVDFLARLAD